VATGSGVKIFSEIGVTWENSRGRGNNSRDAVGKGEGTWARREISVLKKKQLLFWYPRGGEGGGRFGVGFLFGMGPFLDEKGCSPGDAARPQGITRVGRGHRRTWGDISPAHHRDTYLSENNKGSCVSQLFDVIKRSGELIGCLVRLGGERALWNLRGGTSRGPEIWFELLR